MPPSSRFWDKIADRYAKSPVRDEQSYQRKLQITRDFLRPDMELLEFGCGTGSTALVHAPRVKHIRAIDISSRMIEIARDKAEAAGVENVSFERATIEELSVPDGSFDAVLALSILHLLEDRDAAILKVHKMLKPGGLFVSSTPCLGDWLRIFKLVGPIGRFLGLMPLVRIFTTKQLEQSLVDAGFEIVHQWQPDRKKALFIVARKAVS